MRSRALLSFLLLAGVGVAACSGDPNDPRTWAKKLGNLRTQKEALDALAKMDNERAKAALPELIALYKETKNPDHLAFIARFKAPESKPIFLEALDFSDDDFDKAVVAAGALGDMKATDAVDALSKAAEKPLPIKSRANAVRLAAIRSLARIGDPAAVPALTHILETSADEQDFLLNQKAALALAELRDPRAVPSLIKGLFMTGRGANIFQECRLALVRIGAPAVDPVIALLERKNADVEAMGKKLKFDEVTPGVIPTKAAWLLGDLRSPKAVGPLLAALKKPEQGGEHTNVIMALGQIGSGPAVDALVSLVKDAKAPAKDRFAAADALYLTGDKRAVPTLLDVAKTGYVTVDGQKASDLRANAAIDLSRIAGKEHYDAFKALADKETEAEGPFGEALDRMQVAKECGDDLACYGKKLHDPSPTRAEKAAFAIGFSGDAKRGIPLLLAALKPVASMAQDRFVVQQAVLFALTRLANKGCADCVDKLEKQIDRDEKSVRIPGARDLLGETRVTLAVIQNRG